MSGLVIAAIGFQLLLCSVSSAASVCSEGIDRSARRIPISVAQAFREIVDRHYTHEQTQRLLEPGYQLCECVATEVNLAPSHDGIIVRQCGPIWMLDLPPPTMG